MRFLGFLLLLLLAVPGWALSAEQASGAEQLTPEQVKQNAQDFHILDVRSRKEYAEGHVPGAVHIPHDRIQAKLSSLPQDKDAPLVIYCRTGRKAGLATTKLKQMGYSKIFHMQGNMPGWAEKGFEISYD
jgi:phage shock protein E